MRRRCPWFTTAGRGGRGLRTIRRSGACASLGMIARGGAPLGMVSRGSASLGMIPRSGASLGMISRSGASLGTIPRNGTGTTLGTIPGIGSSLRMIARSGASLGMIPGTGGPGALESSIPTSPLAAIVAVIKILVIVPAHLVSAPLRILPLKIIPVLGTGLIPRIPPRCIPVSGSDDIDLRIGVIRGKSDFRAEKVIQDPIQEPITLVEGPGRIVPNIRRHSNRLDRVIALGGTRSGRHADRASSQHDCQQQKNN